MNFLFIILITIFCIYIFRNSLILRIYQLPIIRKSWQLPEFSSSEFSINKENKKPVVVCCGDSITHGHIGYDWVGSLRKKDKKKLFVNAGINADLTWNLNQRVRDIIKHNPDYVTILIGTNDAIGSQPVKQIQQYYIQTKGLPKKPSIEWFEEQIDELVSTLIKKTNARIALITLPFLGEQKDSEIIQVVKNHNRIIRNVSNKYGTILLDFFKEFDSIIIDNNSIPYTTSELRRLRGLRAVILHYVFNWTWKDIGRKYNLKLLCDHIHLNEDGGQILENMVEEFLKE